MIRRPPRSTPLYSSAASDVYKRQFMCLVEGTAPVLLSVGLPNSMLYADGAFTTRYLIFSIRRQRQMCIRDRSESAAQVEGERNCSETAREAGIARALIASEKNPQPVEEWLEKKINGKMFKLGKTLDSETQNQIAKVISRHLDAFAWSASDMSGIDPDFL